MADHRADCSAHGGRQHRDDICAKRSLAEDLCEHEHPENLTRKQASNLELIKRSTRSEEPGGAGMINVIRVMLAGPVQTPAGKEIRQ